MDATSWTPDAAGSGAKEKQAPPAKMDSAAGAGLPCAPELPPVARSGATSRPGRRTRGRKPHTFVWGNGPQGRVFLGARSRPGRRTRGRKPHTFVWGNGPQGRVF